MMDDAGFVEMLDLCYRTVDTPDCWQALTARITHGLNADAGDIVIEDYDTGVARALGTIGFDPFYRESYDVEFVGSNGWIEELKKFPRGKAVPNQAEPEDFERTPTSTNGSSRKDSVMPSAPSLKTIASASCISAFYARGITAPSRSRTQNPSTGFCRTSIAPQ